VIAKTNHQKKMIILNMEKRRTREKIVFLMMIMKMQEILMMNVRDDQGEEKQNKLEK